MIKPASFALLCGIIVTSTIGCSEIVSTHGQVLTTNQVDSIQIGVDNKDSVMRRLGSPSTTGTFNDQRWYYMTSTTSNKPLNPNLLQNRQVLIVDFDEKGLVSAVMRKDEEDAKDVPQVEKTTPTHGQSMGIMDQLLQNIGVAP